MSDGMIIKLNPDYDDSHENKLDSNYLSKIFEMMKEQAEHPIDCGDTWRVVVSSKHRVDGKDEVVAEMFFDRRDGVFDRQSAIDYIVKNFGSTLPDNAKIEAYKE